MKLAPGGQLDHVDLQTVAARAGPAPGRAALIRANAALAVAKAGPLAALDLNAGVLSATGQRRSSPPRSAPSGRDVTASGERAVNVPLVG